MNNQPHVAKKIFKDILPILIGEIVVAVLVCLGFGALHVAGLYDFTNSIIWGAILGAAVILLNYVALIISVDVQIENFMNARGNKQMSDEEIEKFAKEGAAPIQKALKFSTFIRTGTAIAALVLALLTGWFNAIATAIPIFAFRPLLTMSGMLLRKYDKKPDPTKFIKYDDEEINENEEESDQ